MFLEFVDINSQINNRAVPLHHCSLPLDNSRFQSSSSSLSIDEVVCRKSNILLREPIELPCKHLVHYNSRFDSLKTSLQVFPCPQSHPLSLQFSAPSITDPQVPETASHPVWEPFTKMTKTSLV